LPVLSCCEKTDTIYISANFIYLFYLFKRKKNNLKTDLFIQNEERLLRTLRDALDVEWNNLQDACLWVDAVLNEQKSARDDELARFKVFKLFYFYKYIFSFIVRISTRT
jgi:hypothetical protein